MGGGFDTLDFTMNSGTITVTDNDSDISVESSFDWTGGVINDSSYLDHVIVNGPASATIDPGGGSLTSGDGFIFQNQVVGGTTVGPTTTFDAGTLNLNNGAGIFNDTMGEMDWQGMTVACAALPPGVTQQPITNYGIDKHGSGKTEATGTQYLNSGFLWVYNGSTYQVLGGDGSNPSVTQVAGSSGITDIQGGSKLSVAHRFVVASGTLETDSGATSQTATIQGDLLVAGSSTVVKINDDVGTHVFGTLAVTGDVTWSGGTYVTNIDIVNAGVCDQWTAGGTFSANGQNDTISIQYGGGEIPTGTGWDVIEAGTSLNISWSFSSPGGPFSWTVTATDLTLTT
jgi:hypothetical protein